MRLSVWDEIQEAIRGPHAIPRGESEPVYEVRNAAHDLVLTFQGRSGCQLCGHRHDVHSTVLPFSPCLDCDCIGWTALAPPPNPSIRRRSVPTMSGGPR